MDIDLKTSELLFEKLLQLERVMRSRLKEKQKETHHLRRPAGSEQS